ncbi:MAG TPA: hypothetical protein VFN38_09110 [Gemmatimonadaceae bacterium]|nr:hypothetical protein [Gemmatimonadaceae bacterium]
MGAPASTTRGADPADPRAGEDDEEEEGEGARAGDGYGAASWREQAVQAIAARSVKDLRM